MPPTNPKALRWAAWLNRHLELRGNMRQIDLVEASGHRLKAANVSKWVAGTNAADADGAVIVANVFHVPAHEALRAASHPEIADLVDPAVNPGASDVVPRPVDPIVEEIMGWTHLGMKVREALIGQYRADREAALERARATAELLQAQNGNASSHQ